MTEQVGRQLLRTRDFIDARYAEPLDLRTLARQAGTSPAHFSREFRQAFGETALQYVRSRRLERAAALLRSTDRSIAEICSTVGLRSTGSFTTGFSRAFGGGRRAVGRLPRLQALPPDAAPGSLD